MSRCPPAPLKPRDGHVQFTVAPPAGGFLVGRYLVSAFHGQARVATTEFIVDAAPPTPTPKPTR